MHAPAAEIAMGAGVPVRVLNTDGRSPGTLVAGAGMLVEEPLQRVATAVTHSEGITRFVVALPDGAKRAGAVTAVFRAMADAGVSLDMFTPLDGWLALSADTEAAERVGGILDALALAFQRRDHLAKVTVVGAGMHGIPGVMARVAEALGSSGIEILQSADSHYTISVLVADGSALAAVNALHTTFGLGVE
jgi:aspartate kinase